MVPPESGIRTLLRDASLPEHWKWQRNPPTAGQVETTATPVVPRVGEEEQMKKHAKGALAAGTAAVLLLGGAGTLAYWSDSHGIGGDDITSGHLSLTKGTDSGWLYADGANAGKAVTKIVPGDSIVSTHTFTIKADGDNLAARLTAPTSVTPNLSGNTAESVKMPVAVTYDVNGEAAPSTITSENDGDVVTAKVKVDFPYGDKEAENINDTQDMTASLGNIAITLEQTQPAAS